MKKRIKFGLALCFMAIGAIGFSQEIENPEEVGSTEIVENVEVEDSGKIVKETKAKKDKRVQIIDEDEESKNHLGLDNKNAIGFYVLGSQSTIGGIQYERRFSDLVSAQFNTYVFYNTNTTWSNILDYNINAQLNFRLFEYAWKNVFASRLFAYAMIGHRGFIENVYDYETYDFKPSEDFSATMIGSAGFGFDIILYEHLSLLLEFGFMGSYPNDAFAGICIGSGVRYAF